MGRLCKRYITISGILLIYAICLPSAFISHANNIIQVQNNFNIPIKSTQWNLEQVLNQSVIKQIENRLDRQNNNKDKILCVYELLQKYLGNKVENYRFICDIAYDKTYIPIRIDDKFNKYDFDLEDQDNGILTNRYIDKNNTLEKYLKENYKLCRNGNYIQYKIILGEMNDKDNKLNIRI